MQADLFRCSFCSELYDLEFHLPKVLVYCPHYLCLECLKITFALYSPQRRKCPICHVSFPSKLKTPEDFLTDRVLLQLLPIRPKTNLADDMELIHKRDLYAKKNNEDEHLFQDYHVRKKQKVEQYIDEMIKLPKLTTTTEGLTQLPQDHDFSSKIEEEQTKIKMENSDDEDSFALKSEVTIKVTENSEKIEQEFDDAEEDKSPSKNREIEEEIQEMERQIMQIEVASLLRLDFAQKTLSETIFTHLCSNDFWSGIDKNKFLYFEVVELDFSASSLTDQQFVKFVQNIMPALENLTSLMINFALTKISSESLQALSSQCLKKHKLKSFRLNCSQTSIGDEGFKSLDEGLNCPLETLEEIELIFDSTDVQGEEFLDSLFGMNQLQHLKLSFENSQISSEILSAVFLSLSSLAKSLESLELNFNRACVDDKNLEKLASHAISQMKGLKHLKLCLRETFVSNDFFLALFQSLSSLATHLEALELDLHSTKLSNAAFKKFCKEVLNKMQNIENLKLDLNQTRITDTSLKNLRLPVNRLKSLALHVNENKIHDSALKIFKENNNFQNIKNINFQAEKTDVSDETLQDFLNHVEKACLPLADKNEINIAKKFDLKRRVLLELKKELSLHYGSNSEPSDLSYLQIFRFIHQLESKAYDNILTKALAKTLPNSKITATELAKWKKLIENMTRTSLLCNKKFKKIIGKKHIYSNNRIKEAQMSTQTKQNKINTERKQHGCNHNYPSQSQISNKISSVKNITPCEFVLSFRWLKKYAQEISFREKVIEILKSMETRTFFVFYQRLLDFLLGLSKTYQVWQFPAKLDNLNNAYSWWSRFIKGDQETANLWRNLPFSRGKQEYHE